MPTRTVGTTSVTSVNIIGDFATRSWSRDVLSLSRVKANRIKDGGGHRRLVSKVAINLQLAEARHAGLARMSWQGAVSFEDRLALTSVTEPA